MWTDSPVIAVTVMRPTVDVIHVSAGLNYGWKLDGFKGDELVAPDQLQDRFDVIIRELAMYVDDTTVWTNTETGESISAWEAMRLLTKADGEDVIVPVEG
jgi:hypothetical protein